MAELQHIPHQGGSSIVRSGTRSNALATRGLQDLRCTEEALQWLKRGLELRQQCFDEARASNTPYWTDPNHRLGEAFASFERGIKSNPDHPELQFMLGLCYSDGEGVERDDRKAFFWTRKAAEQGYAEAQDALGCMYTNRLSGLDYGVPLDDVQGAYWFRKAAQQGHAIAQLALAGLCAGGDGVEQDYVQAAYWFTKAAEQGEQSAQADLGKLYEDGLGVPQDYAQAAVWYRKAAEQGLSTEAQYRLGLLYFYGQGVAQDYAEAAHWFRKATCGGRGHTDAQYYLGFMYQYGRGVQHDDVQAAMWYRKAAEGDREDMLQTIEGELVWAKSTDKGRSEAQFNLAEMCEEGRGVNQDYAQAAYWYRKAADQGHSDAQNNLGVLYDNGQGVPQDELLAAFWYRKAREDGPMDVEAQEIRVRERQSPQSRKVDPKLSEDQKKRIAEGA